MLPLTNHDSSEVAVRSLQFTQIHRKEQNKNIDHYLWPGLRWGTFSIVKEDQQHFVPRTGVVNFHSLG